MNKIPLCKEPFEYPGEFWTLFGYISSGHFERVTLFIYVMEAAMNLRISMQEASELCVLISTFYTDEEMTKREAEL